MRITIVVHVSLARAGEPSGVGMRSTAERYVLVPDTLITTCAHDPLAVGVYIAIARLAMIAKGSVTLAARDLARWMGSDRNAERVAIMRRIVKLEARGWLMIARAPATKHRLLPTWGRDQAGSARPWRFEQSNSGRPAHLRGRRLPMALLDDYLGRLDLQPAQGRALVCRYFTRPLLDLIDIGVYAIGLRAEVIPTPRLRHLELYGDIGMLPPRSSRSLLELAAAGKLTTLEHEVAAPVLLSIQGHARLASTVPSASQYALLSSTSLHGSVHRSPDGSTNTSEALPQSPHQDDQNAARFCTSSQIVWDVGMVQESTNHDSTPDPDRVVGDTSIALNYYVNKPHDRPACAQAIPDALSPEYTSVNLTEVASSLAKAVVAGHCVLNPSRTILPGEWHELRELQDTHGAEQLQIWQARASRAQAERPHGVTPAYYQACAAQAACAVYRPSPTSCTQTAVAGAEVHLSAPAPLVLDPACDAMLRAMGVRQRQQLAGVSYDLIVAWHAVLEHPGLAARFTSPLGFAVTQMRRGNPPPIRELDRWAKRTCQDERYEAWRYVEAPVITSTAITYEQQLEAYVRTIAPANADLGDLCILAGRLEAGATNAEALAYLQASIGGYA